MSAADILVSLVLWVAGSAIYQFIAGPRPWALDFIAGAVFFGVMLSAVAAIRS